MNKKTGMFIIAILLVAALLTTAPSCKKGSPKPISGEDASENESDQDVDSSEGGEEEDGDELVKAEPLVPEILLFATKHGNNKIIPFDEILEKMQIYKSRPNIDFHIDTVGNNIYPDPAIEPEGYQSFTDIIAWGGAWMQFQPDSTTPTLYEIWPAGYHDPDLNSWTVYPDNWQPYDGNEWYWTFIILDGDVPFTHNSLACTYASVSRTDDNPDNDYVPSELYPLDFNQNTDRWDTTWYTPGANWTYMATGDNFQELTTSGFVFVYRNVVGWFYSGSDIDSNYFAWRGWVQCINQDLDPSSSGADTIMANPRAELVPVDSWKPVVLFDLDE
jgi:hypothetical protein